MAQGPRIPFSGVLLIVLGCLFLADQMGVLSFQHFFRQWWPAIMVLAGLLNLIEKSGNIEAAQVNGSFRGSFVTKLNCLGCKHEKIRKKEEPFFMISLPLVPEKQKYACEFYAIAGQKQPLELISRKMVLLEDELAFEDIARQLISHLSAPYFFCWIRKKCEA